MLNLPLHLWTKRLPLEIWTKKALIIELRLTRALLKKEKAVAKRLYEAVSLFEEGRLELEARIEALEE